MKYGFAALFIASSIGVFTACSSTPAAKTSATAMSEEDIKKGKVCTYEIPVGSNLKQKRCTTAGEREALRRQGEQIPSAPPPGSAR